MQPTVHPSETAVVKFDKCTYNLEKKSTVMRMTMETIELQNLEDNIITSKDDAWRQQFETLELFEEVEL